MLGLLQQFQVDHLAWAGKTPGDTSSLPDPLGDWRRIQQLKTEADQLIRVEVEQLADGQWRVIPLEEPVHARRVADQLGTPLIPARRRKALLEALLAGVSEATQRGPHRSSTNGTDLRGTPAHWEQLLHRAELHGKLLGLADPAQVAQLDRNYLRVIREQTPPRRGGESGLLRHYRKFAGDLLVHYGALPANIRTPGAGARSRLDAMRLAMFVDPRDVLSVGAPAQLVPEFPFETAKPSVFRVKGPGNELRVSMKSNDARWTPVGWDIRWLGKGTHGVKAFLEFDKRIIAVRSVPSRRELSPDEIVDQAEVGGDSSWPLRFEVIALVERESSDDEDSALLTLRLERDENTEVGPPQIVGDSLAVRCLLPRPNRVDLVVTRIAPHVRPQKTTDNFSLVRGEEDGVTLRLFPNQKTHFQLALVNRFDEEKTVEVELVRVPGPHQGEWPRGRLFAANGHVREVVQARLVDPDAPAGVARLLGEPKVLSKVAQPLVLPEDSSVDLKPEPVTIDFTPLADMGRKPAESAPDPAAAKATPPPLPEITDGLACVVTEVNGGRRWIHWIALDPLVPRDYVQPAIGYVAQLSGILVNVKAKRPDLLPLAYAEEPIEVVWDTSRIDAALLPIEAELNDAAQPASLSAAVPADGKQQEVWLSVNRYPRAFMYRVRCEANSRGVDIEPSLESVVITELSAPGFSKIYRFTATGAPPAIPEEPPEGKQFVYLRAGDVLSPAVFPNTAKKLHVKFRADAPDGPVCRIDSGLERPRDEFGRPGERADVCRRAPYRARQERRRGPTADTDR
jgi:hypothetical protein